MSENTDSAESVQSIYKPSGFPGNYCMSSNNKFNSNSHKKRNIDTGWVSRRTILYWNCWSIQYVGWLKTSLLSSSHLHYALSFLISFLLFPTSFPPHPSSPPSPAPPPHSFSPLSLSLYQRESKMNAFTLPAYRKLAIFHSKHANEWSLHTGRHIQKQDGAERYHWSTVSNSRN